MLKTGTSREVITPARGVPLVGYFNPRPNTGVLDDLFVKALLFEKNSVVCGLVTFDLAFLTAELVSDVIRNLSESGLDFGGNLIFSAIHTHTGPYVSNFAGVGPEAEYLEFLKNKAALAVSRAFANLAESELLVGSVRNNPYAFNRRYWMKDGRVVTNPGKLNPDIVKPEGPVDDEIPILAVRQDGRVVALAVNIVNHTDTIGGNLVSADWPGRMERELQDRLGHDLPVLTLLGCSGNINHFDISTAANQTSYQEANRIGKGYAEIISGQIDSLEPVDFDRIRIAAEDFIIPFRRISSEHLRDAEKTLARIKDVSSGQDMTSEGLAKGEGPVARFFAEQLIAYGKNCSGRERAFKLVTVKFGNRILFATLPGEMFTEIGLEVKAASPFKFNFMISLAMGECGYVPLPECFERGGYEILPVEGGGPREDTAPRLVKALKRLIDPGENA